jgi:hypothetical protein
MASRGVCPHCESDQATLDYCIVGSIQNEEGFCCDNFCLNAYFIEKIVAFIKAQKEEYTHGLAIIKARTIAGSVTPFVQKLKRAIVLSISTFHFLLEKDEANYRLFRPKALEQWVDLIGLSPDDGLLVLNGKGSKEFFDWCKQAEAILFPCAKFD